ncbi:MAG: hypothetical protein ACFFB3_08975 [Candidatus Hodarchaeota archaeon]
MAYPKVQLRWKETNPFKWPLSVLFGFVVVISEIVFTSRAYFLWPVEQSGAFSIFKNWHSDLGSLAAGFNSVEGALYHNVGLAFQGLALIMFCGGLYIADVAEGQNRRLFQIAQLFGLLTGFAFIMAAVYSLDLKADHQFWASGIFICAIPFVGFLSYLYSKYPGYKRVIGLYGLAVTLTDALFAMTFISPLRIVILEYFALWGIYSFILLVTLHLFVNEVLEIEIGSFKTSIRAQTPSPEVIASNSKSIADAIAAEAISITNDSPKSSYFEG